MCIRDRVQPVEQSPAVQNANEEKPLEGGPTGDAVLDNLGIGETKDANPDVNPLGDKFDDLLEGVK